MSQVGLEYSALRRGSDSWRSLASLMSTTSRDLGAASTGGLPPSVQGAATTFLTRWSRYAEESAAIADGFSGALAAASNDFSTTEDATDRRFSDLDGRLGPAR